MFAPKKILVPTNFSEYSDEALKKALDIAYQYKAKIYLLHVISDKFYQWSLGGISTGSVIDQLESESVQYAEEMLQKQMNAYALARKVEIIPIIRIGSLSRVILSEEKDKD
ncbi:MAG: universal stress protein, partial [Syntrophales bacterium]|nr:universal stress protein [Syntrophales bacterium]